MLCNNSNFRDYSFHIISGHSIPESKEVSGKKENQVSTSTYQKLFCFAIEQNAF